MSLEKKLGKFLKYNISSSTYSNSKETKPQSQSEAKSSTRGTEVNQFPVPDEFLHQKPIDREEYIKLAREQTIVKCIQLFNESNTVPRKIFVKRIPDYTKSNSENEHEFYSAIDRIIRKSFLKQQYISATESIRSPVSLNREPNRMIQSNGNATSDKTGAGANNKNSNMSVDMLISRLKVKNKPMEFIAVKAIIISLMNVINERIGKLFLMNISGDAPDLDCGIFHRIYDEFLVLSNICPMLEQDFCLSLASFKEKFEMKFSLCELFNDLFWDYIFKIKEINFLFVDFFTSGEKEDYANMVMEEIVKVLWLIKMPLKKNIGEILEMSAITTEKIFIAPLIIEFRNQLTCSHKIVPLEVNINNDCIENEHFDRDDGLKEAQIKNMITESINHQQQLEQIEPLKPLQLFQQELQEKHIQLEQQKIVPETLNRQDEQQIEQRDKQDEHRLKNTKLLPKQTESKGLTKQSIPWELSQASCLPQLCPDIQSAKQDKQPHSTSNGSSRTKKANKGQIKQKQQETVIEAIDDQYISIDELYNYIVNDHSNEKKRNKKKNKRNNTNIIEDNITQATSNSNNSDEVNTVNPLTSKAKSHNNLDLIVEQFKVDLQITNPKASEMQKIRPNISPEWLKSIMIN